MLHSPHLLKLQEDRPPSPASLRVLISPSEALQLWLRPDPSSRTRHVLSPLLSPPLTVPAPYRPRARRCPEADRPSGEASTWSVTYLTPLSAQGAGGAEAGTQSSAVVQDLTQSGEVGACHSASRGHCQVAPTHSLGPVAMGSGPQPGHPWGKGLWEGLTGPDAQQPWPGKGMWLRKPSGVTETPSQAPSPPSHRGRLRCVACPPPHPAASPGAHTLPRPGLLAHATLFAGLPPVIGSPA